MRGRRHKDRGAAAAWVVLFVTMLGGVPAAAQTATTQTLVARLSSADQNIRSAAFESLDRAPSVWNSPAMAAVLLPLFDREERWAAATLTASTAGGRSAEGLGEGFAEYEGRLLDVCLLHCDKQGLLSILLRNAAAGSPSRFDAVELLGTVRARGFSAAQRTAIDDTLIVATADARSDMVRTAALAALGSVVRTDLELAPATRARIHGAATKATADPSATVRIGAVRRLGEIADPADIPLLKRIAAGDTDRVMARGTVAYPVREEALKSLTKIPPR